MKASLVYIAAPTSPIVRHPLALTPNLLLILETFFLEIVLKLYMIVDFSLRSI